MSFSNLYFLLQKISEEKWAEQQAQNIADGDSPQRAREDAATRMMGDPVKSYPPRTTPQATTENG